MLVFVTILHLIDFKFIAAEELLAIVSQHLH